MKKFREACATTTGSEHIGPWSCPLNLPNQDYGNVLNLKDKGWILAVSDGCSDAIDSQHGSKLLVDWTFKVLSQLLEKNVPINKAGMQSIVAELESELCTLMYDTAESLSNPCRPINQVVRETFLATLIVAYVGPTKTYVFGIGDGVYQLNDNYNRLGPFPGNAPPYLGYSLIDNHPKQTPIKVLAEMSTATLKHIILGTDGCCDLVDENNPDLSWVADKKYFDNPKTLVRELRSYNSVEMNYTMEVVAKDILIRVNNDEGLLPDDTTMVALLYEPAPVYAAPVPQPKTKTKKKFGGFVGTLFNMADPTPEEEQPAEDTKIESWIPEQGNGKKNKSSKGYFLNGTPFVD